MRLFHSNLVDLDATEITAVSANSAYPVANIAHPFLAKFYKTGTSTAAEKITFDFGAAKELSALVIAAHDLTAADVVTLQLSSASNFSNGQTIAVERIEGFMLAVFPNVSVRYARLNLTKSAAGQTRQIGRVYLGAHYEFEDDPDYRGYAEDVTDLSKSARSLSGQRYSETRAMYRTLKVPLTGIDGEMADTLQGLVEDLGTHTPCFVQVQDSLGDVNTDPRDEVIYCYLASIADRTVEGVDGRLNWKMQLALEEIPA